MFFGLEERTKSGKKKNEKKGKNIIAAKSGLDERVFILRSITNVNYFLPCLTSFEERRLKISKTELT